MPWVVESADDLVRLVLSGHVDIFEASPLHRLLVELAGERRRVQVDVATCADVDGSGLQLLLAFREARVTRGRPLAFVGGRDRVARLLARFGLEGAWT
jgi:ABC-type transporter Mla MlaB component